MTYMNRRGVGAGLVRRTALACALAPGLLSQGGVTARAQQGQEPADRAAAGIERPPTVNTMPWLQLAEMGNRLVEEGRLGPETTLHLTAEGELDGDGLLRPETIKLAWQAQAKPDESIRVLALAFVRAVSESKILGMGRDQVMAVRMTFELDRQNVSLGLAGEAHSEADAEKLVAGYGSLFTAARIAKRGTPEGAYYEAVKFTSDGKLFKMTFVMPKADAARAVAEILARRAAREQQ